MSTTPTKYEPLSSQDDEATELDSLSVPSIPDHSPPRYSVSEEHDVEAGQVLPRVPSSFPTIRNFSPDVVYSCTQIPEFSRDPQALRDLILQQATHPPKISLDIYGHHTANRGGKDNSTATVIDFKFSIDISSSLRSTPTSSSSIDVASSTVNKDTKSILTRPATPKHHHKLFLAAEYSLAHRGGLTKSTTFHPPSHIQPTDLLSICKSYTSTASTSILPCHFTLTKRAVWNEAYTTQSLVEQIRKTGYTGILEITPRTTSTEFVVRSRHWITRTNYFCLRHTWLWLALLLCQFWIICWPILHFVRRRWEVVTAEWPLAIAHSQQAGEEEEEGAAVRATSSVNVKTEDAWLEGWGPAIVNLAFRRQMGDIDAGMVDKYRRLGVLHRKRQASGEDEDEDAGCGSKLVGFVDARTGSVIGRDGKGERVSDWGN